MQAFELIVDVESYNTFIGISLILTAIFILLRKKNTHLPVLICMFFFIPVIILLITHTVPYNRIWNYLTFPLCLCLATILEYIVSFFNHKTWITYALTFLLALGFCWYTVLKISTSTNPENTGIYQDVSSISSYIIQENPKKIFTNENTYYLYLRYQADIHRKIVIPVMNYTDTASLYDYILLIPNTAFPTNAVKNNYRLREKNNYIEVYEHL
jgi:hypothetical protein